MMDYTDRESVKDFIKENDIRDLAQLDTFLKHKSFANGVKQRWEASP